jgi:hypothetical protein
MLKTQMGDKQFNKYVPVIDHSGIHFAQTGKYRYRNKSIRTVFFSFAKSPFMIDQRLIAMKVQGGYDTELIAALLNSAITFLTLEMRGTSRNLGALDLNANYLKQLRILNPDLLSEQQKTDILTTLQPLKHRKLNPFCRSAKTG